MSNFAPAVEAATKVIEFLAEAKVETGISEISRGVDLNKNMVFRILNTLEQQGWVCCNEQKYSLTLVPFRIISQILNRMSLNNAALPFVYNLWKKTGECTYLAVLHNDKAFYIQHFEGINDVRVAGNVGGEYDLYCSAPGKILLAHSSESFINEYAEREHLKRTENTITDKKGILAELENIRNVGYSTDREEFGKGIACVAAPVFDYTGKVIGALGCSSYTVSGEYQKIIDKFLPDVVSTAKEISVCLGAPMFT